MTFEPRFQREELIKRLVNLSCGFFGFQSKLAGKSGGGYCHYSICCRIPGTCNVSSHRIDIQHGFAHLCNATYYVMAFTSFPSRRRAAAVFPANNALALFFAVVEMGKLRLVQALQFISRYVPPQNWPLLYSNVDNLIIVLEEARSLDEAIFLVNNCQGCAKYLEEKRHFVASRDNGDQVNPRQLKLEWICQSSSWRYITCGVQHYVLREDEEEEDADDDKEGKEAVANAVVAGSFSNQPLTLL